MPGFAGTIPAHVWEHEKADDELFTTPRAFRLSSLREVPSFLRETRRAS